jgi:Spy/CpxP family protein refolding chaperone
MYKNWLAKVLVVSPVFLILFAAPAQTETQNKPLTPASISQLSPQTAHTQAGARPEDDFAGLTLTDDQKAKIEQIHQVTRSHMDIVARDPKSDSEQKQAMLEGMARIERGQIFQVLTPEQQSEVRKKVAARHAAEQQGKKKQPGRIIPR